MTSLRTRRRRRTVLMALVTLVIVAAVPVLGYVGARAILDSEGGKDALADNLPVVPFPSTPTALLATVDGNGRLSSTTVFVVDPSGLGGSIISVPVNADIGFSDDARQSLQGAYVDAGLQGAVDGIESLLRVTINFATEMNPDQASALLQPFGTIPVVLADEVPGDDTHEAIPAGEQQLDPDQAAHVLTAAPADGASESTRRADVDALWAGVVTAVGGGNGAADATAAPATFDDVRAHVFAGHAQTRGLTAQELIDTQNPSGLDVVQLDKAEVVFVFASIAPGAVFAVADGPRIRLVAPSGYDPQVKRTIEVLLYVQGNIVSLDTTADPVTDTTMFVPDDFMVSAAKDAADLLGVDARFGTATERIDGIDITIVLGTTYLDGVTV